MVRPRQPSPVRASRSGVSSVYGKRTEPVKGRVSQPVKDEVIRRYTAAGMSESEWLATFLEAKLFGVEHAVTLQRQRIELATGTGRE